jgi:Ran GTPase-activating protein (RanGAP) involved in mRNA processing and transport
MNASETLRRLRENDPTLSCVCVPPTMLPDALAQALAINTHVAQLVLHGNSDYSTADLCAVLEAVSESRSLRRLDLSAMSLEDAAFEHVAEFIQHSVSLTSLDLSSNVISPFSASLLGTALRGHPSLRSVNLGRTSLGNDGVAQLLAQMGPAGRCGLVKLDLTHCGMQPAGGALLEAFVLQSRSLVHVNVSGNFLSPESLLAIQNKLHANQGTLPAQDLRRLLGCAATAKACPTLRLLVAAFDGRTILVKEAQ